MMKLKTFCCVVFVLLFSASLCLGGQVTKAGELHVATIFYEVGNGGGIKPMFYRFFWFLHNDSMVDHGRIFVGGR